MDTLVLRNIGSSTLYIDDLGIEVRVNEDLDILQNFTAEDITESINFELAFSQGARVVLNGSTIMSYQDVIDYLTPLTRWDKLDYSYISGKDDISDITASELEELTSGSDITLHNHDNRYYTETELQTPGQSQIHYDNIIGAPTGQFRVENGDLYFMDTIRNKWLSAGEINYVWAESNIDGRYMSIGNVTSSATGFLLPQDFTITKISIASTGELNKEIEIRNDTLPIYTFNLNNGLYTSTSLNIDLQSGDLLRIFVSGAGAKISDVVATVFGKWRIV